jgi:NTE family protein
MKVGLVLGGGGARGLAHIGAMRALEERELQPAAIAACSIGGIIGALIAAGHGWRHILELASAFPGVYFGIGGKGGLLSTRGMESALRDELPQRFEDLEIPMRVTAVDVQAGRLVILEKGPLLPALRASSALPGILSPAKLGDSYLVDGGLLNNVPVDLIREMTDAPVVAVDVSVPPDIPLALDEADTWWRTLAHRIQEGQPFLTLEIFLKGFIIPQAALTRARLREHPPDLLIRPDLSRKIRMQDFHRCDEAMEEGHRASKEALENWKQLREPA